MADQYINCPHCGKRIEVSKLLTEQIARDLRKNFDAKSAQLQKEMDERLRETLQKETSRIEQQAKKSAEQKHIAEIASFEAKLREKEKEAIDIKKDADKRLQDAIAKEKIRIEQHARKSAEQKHSAKIVALETKLRESEKQAIEFQKQRASLKKQENQLIVRQKRMDSEIMKAKQAATDEFRSRELELEKKVREAKRQAIDIQKDADKRLRDAIEKEKLRIEQQAKKSAEQKHSAKIVALETKLRKSEEQAIEFQKQRAGLQKQENQLIARQKRMDSEVKKAEQAATDKFRSRELELEKKVRDATEQAVELKRKLEQSSQQTQGEIAELELENNLKKAFPSDDIKPIAKGKTGADILQTVYSSDGNACGTIIWESKNSTKWGKAWLPKLRSDQRRAKAQVAVLVSIVLPKNAQHFVNIEGVWVCEFSVALNLATALRINLIQLALANQSKSDRGKMESLFQYVSGTEFKHRVEAIVEAFTSMRDDLSKERQSMEKHWATRQKQLDIFVENVAGLYGDMQAIAGQALPKIRRLELPQSTS
jgi:hypothetical protein